MTFFTDTYLVSCDALAIPEHSAHEVNAHDHAEAASLVCQSLAEQGNWPDFFKHYEVCVVRAHGPRDEKWCFVKVTPHVEVDMMEVDNG